MKNIIARYIHQTSYTNQIRKIFKILKQFIFFSNFLFVTVALCIHKCNICKALGFSINIPYFTYIQRQSVYASLFLVKRIRSIAISTDLYFLHPLRAQKIFFSRCCCICSVCYFCQVNFWHWWNASLKCYDKNVCIFVPPFALKAYTHSNIETTWMNCFKK